jgi:diguanylate cyclase (GGDEF)-like protein
MGSVSRTASPGWLGAVRTWPVWKLPAWLLAYVLSVIAVDAFAIIAALTLTSFTGRDAEIFLVLIACNAATVEMTRRSGEPAGLIQDVSAIWELPVALLLPPLYGLLAPIVWVAHTQWRVRRTLPHRRIFSAAAQGLTYGAASVGFHALAPATSGLAPFGHSAELQAWAAAVVVIGVLRSALNKVLVMIPVKASDPATSIRASLFTRESMIGDAAELSVGVLVAYAATAGPLMALFGLPCVVALQRSLRHHQLVNASRIDDKTGLMNHKTWQREAGVQVTRAARNRATAQLAVLIVDVDDFKRDINDRLGHLTGDAVLAAIAATLTGALREYDLCGRWGGEEFAILLPDTAPLEAMGIARRLCKTISALTVPAEGSGIIPGMDARPTVSIGVATLEDTSCDLVALTAAADAAMYKAKAAGKNTVRGVEAA